jgi:hypothetical protein
MPPGRLAAVCGYSVSWLRVGWAQAAEQGRDGGRGREKGSGREYQRQAMVEGGR